MGERATYEVPLRAQRRIIAAVRAQLLAENPVLRAATALHKALCMAEPIIARDRTALHEAHVHPRTGRVDPVARPWMREYDALLRAVRAALRKAEGRAR